MAVVVVVMRVQRFPQSCSWCNGTLDTVLYYGTNNTTVVVVVVFVFVFGFVVVIAVVVSVAVQRRG